MYVQNLQHLSSATFECIKENVSPKGLKHSWNVSWCCHKIYLFTFSYVVLFLFSVGLKQCKQCNFIGIKNILRLVLLPTFFNSLDISAP